MKEINIQELRRNFEELKRQPEHKLYLETNSLYRIKVMLFEQALKPKYYSIAALGQFSSGKSTMINALVGESLLIEKSEESTSVITNLRYGSKKQIILENLDGSNQVVACTHENLQKYTTKAFSESHNIKEATIEVPLAYLQNDIQLIDTPGSNSLNQELFEKTKFIIDQSIAVIMTIPAGKFTQSEQVFVQQIKQAKQHLFVVLTRKSDVNPKEHNDNIKSTEKILNQVLEKKDYTVVLVDSKQALEAKQTKNQELLQRSGYLEFEQKIADYIASGKYVQDYQAIVKQKYDELESIYLEIEENKTKERQKQDEVLRIQRGRYKKSLFEEKDNIMNLFLAELQHNLRKTQQENENYYLKQIESSHKNFKNSSEPEFEKIDKQIKLVGTSSNFKSTVEDVKKQAKNIPLVYQQNLNDLSTTLSQFLIANQNSFKGVIIGDFQQSFEKNLNQQMT
ncbi:MAG: dynamin family protein, partial [Culicoidibacterales bacterium]